MTQRVECLFAGKTLTLETGRIARQAHGSIWLQHGDLVVLATAVSSTPRAGIDFFPLTVEYREKFTAVGKFPGGFIKRENRPTEKEILTARCIDRPMRPLFPKGFVNEVQIIAQVESADPTEAPETLALVAASAAVNISGIPFGGPIAAVSVSKIDGQLVLNAPISEQEKATLYFVVAGTREKVIMIEGQALQASEAEVDEAIRFGHQQLQPLIELQEKLMKIAGKPVQEYTPMLPSDAVTAAVAAARGKVVSALRITGKAERNTALALIKKEILTPLAADERFVAENPGTFAVAYDDLVGACMREKMLQDKKRVDGRGATDIRAITCEVGILPRTHGSALFTRGETQSLAVVTLGTSDDEQRFESLAGEASKNFMLHYSFPPYSVGETKPMRAPSRRDIGHGNLAERSLRAVVPAEFMYTIRITSEITESNGSSSMASVCGGTLALMDAGVPIQAPVAGISVGLIEEGSTQLLITDIIGDEDHFGDMDFKVAGTAQGITGVQVDFKIAGLKPEIIGKILGQAREGRMIILAEMAKTLATPRPAISPLAPKILTVHIPVDKIGALIGPGGKNVRKIQEETKTKIAIEDDGTVQIAADNEERAEAGRKRVEMLVAEAEIGKVYDGRVTRIMNFGAFIQILAEVEGMVHIGEICDERIRAVEDKLKIGDLVKARVVEIDEKGRVNLSMRNLDKEFDPATMVRQREGGGGERRGGFGGGDRDRRGGGDRDRRSDGPPRRHS